NIAGLCCGTKARARPRISPVLAHRDASRQRSTSVAFGTKRTLTELRLQKADYEHMARRAVVPSSTSKMILAACRSSQVRIWIGRGRAEREVLGVWGTPLSL